MLPLDNILIPLLITVAFAAGVFVLNRQAKARLEDLNSLNQSLQDQLSTKQNQLDSTQLALSEAATAQALAQAAEQTLKTQLCLLYTSPSPRDQRGSRMPSSA